MLRAAQSYMVSHRISPATSSQIIQYFRSEQAAGQTDAADDDDVLSRLPLPLRRDLIREARSHWTLIHPVFHALNRCHSRFYNLLVCETMQTHVYVVDTAIFGYDELCSAFLIVHTGRLAYTRFTPTSYNVMSFYESAESFTHRDEELVRNLDVEHWVLTGPRFVCEPALWCKWSHTGNLITTHTSTLLELRIDRWVDLLHISPQACFSMVEHARQFVTDLNAQDRRCDLYDSNSYFEESVGGISAMLTRSMTW